MGLEEFGGPVPAKGEKTFPGQSIPGRAADPNLGRSGPPKWRRQGCTHFRSNFGMQPEKPKKTVNVTATVTDANNNPVPDGFRVAFEAHPNNLDKS